MRLAAILSLAFTTTLLLLGCGTKSSSTTGTDPKVADAKEKIKDAVDATVAAAKSKRDEYARDMQKKLDELDATYKDLEHRAAAAKDQDKKKLVENVNAAKAKRDAAARKLDELKAASHDRWEKVKEGIENAFEDLKKAVH